MRNSALDNPNFLARTIGDWLTSWAGGAKQALRSFAEVPLLPIDRSSRASASEAGAGKTAADNPESCE